jgi:acetyl-CoA carboxylase carboxyl transferase subunit alpha
MEETEIRAAIEKLKEIAGQTAVDLTEDILRIEKRIREAAENVKAPEIPNAWAKVELARHVERPSAEDYIRLICDDFIELHGDRNFADDPAIVGGIGTVAGRPVTFICNRKGRNLRDNIRFNYGMANPEGYRKALRLAKQAEKFKRPIVTLIDTPGAFPGIGAEERGIGEAIARNLMEFSRLKTVIVSFVIGEGGSGGALGIGVGDKIYMLENSVYSVITPEGFSSILLRDSSKAKEAAEIMKITAADVYGFKIVNGIVSEPKGGAQFDPEAVAARIKGIILTELDHFDGREIEAIVRYRHKKIREIGMFSEGAASE